MHGGSGWGWQNSLISSANTTSNITIYPTAITYGPPQPLRSVVEGPVDDRKWLDAQIAEVCDLAAAA